MSKKYTSCPLLTCSKVFFYFYFKTGSISTATAVISVCFCFLQWCKKEHDWLLKSTHHRRWVCTGKYLVLWLDQIKNKIHTAMMLVEVCVESWICWITWTPWAWDQSLLWYFIVQHPWPLNIIESSSTMCLKKMHKLTVRTF